MIDFRCTNCGKLLRTGPETAGKRAKCPDCGTLLTIPLPGGEGPAPPLPGGALPAGGMPPARPPQGPSVNPFQSPQAPLGGVAPAAAAPITPATLDMNDLFATTWAVFKANLGMAIALPLVIQLIVFVIVLVAQFVLMAIMAATKSGVVVGLLGFVAWVAVMAIFAGLMVGVLKTFLKMARGQPYAFGDLFSFGPELVPFILTYLLFAIIVNVGTLLCIVPGVFLATMFSQCLFLVIDRNANVMDAFNQSKDLTNGNKMTIFLTYFLGVLGAMIVSVLTCGLGGLVAAPFMWLLGVVMYLRITGQPIAAPVQ